MLEDIEAGKVGIVLTKDMSRIGQNYLQTGFYTEVLFRKRGVRFIAIENGVDSADIASSEFVPFLNIMKSSICGIAAESKRRRIRPERKPGNGSPTT